MKRIVAVVIATSLCIAQATAAQLLEEALDGTTPAAPPNANDSRGESLCQGDWREADGPEEAALVEAGWLLFFAPQVLGDTRAVIASSWLDRQCRPQDLTVFAFSNGRAVAKVASPSPDARLGMQLNDAGTLVVESTFAQAGDANCCPSGRTTLVVRVSSAQEER